MKGLAVLAMIFVFACNNGGGEKTCGGPNEPPCPEESGVYQYVDSNVVDSTKVKDTVIITNENN